MSRVYTAGRRFDSLVMNCIMAESGLITVMFFLLITFNVYPGLSAASAVLILIAAIAVSCLLIVLAGKVLRSFIRYEVTADCLIVSKGRRMCRYPWRNFTSVYLDTTKTKDPLPFVFEAAGQTVHINQYTDNLHSLAEDILHHVGAYAHIDPELISGLGI